MCFYQEEDVLSGIMAEIVPLPCNSAADYFRLRIFTMISWVRKSLSGYSRTYYSMMHTVDKTKYIFHEQI